VIRGQLIPLSNPLFHLIRANLFDRARAVIQRRRLPQTPSSASPEGGEPLQALGSRHETGGHRSILHISEDRRQRRAAGTIGSA